MVTDNILMEAIQTLESLNLPIPNWFVKLIVVALFLVLIYEYILIKFFNLFKKVTESIKERFYPLEINRFVDIRKIFVEHLDSEVKRLNREADWNDFYYTELEAEVEIDPSLDFYARSAKNPIVWLRSFHHIIRSSFGMSPTLKVQKNLIQAIRSSNSRVFLVIGDPGSGKTVSLRHLFLEMTKICASSRNKDAIVPIYLNLKHLNVEPGKVDADRIHDWIIGQLRADQDRTIHDFLDKNFEQMLKDGNFFFLFDSFDEIPAVMDAREDQEVVRQYAMALDRFLHSQHRCRGLVGSRPYRAPKTFIGQRMTIRPLSNKRIKNALFKYMGQELVLAAQLWQELVQNREDMLYVAQNPFYLGLLTRYAKEKQRLPERNYDLFENFVQTRAKTDENRLQHFGLTPAELIEQASILAFAMTKTPNIGLEANVNQIRKITSGAWNPSDIEPLLHALSYSKLGRLSREEPGNPRIFSFVHRRFHEYFCARYLKQNPTIAPFENLAADDRWREILVLLCEVLPGDYLTRIFDTARSALTSGINVDSGSIEHQKAIETTRFLRDGFHNRVNDIPNDIRVLCSKFIQKQLKSGNLLDKKRAIEGVGLVDDESVNSILESAFRSESAWLRETALRSCRILRTVPEQIAKSIRRHLHHRYSQFEIHKDYAFYSVLFSSSPALHTFKTFLKILITVELAQILVYAGIFIYGLIFDIRIILAFLVGLLAAIILMHRWSWEALAFGALFFNNLATSIIRMAEYNIQPSFSINPINDIFALFVLFVLLNFFLTIIASYYPNNFSALFMYLTKIPAYIAKIFAYIPKIPIELPRYVFRNWKDLALIGYLFLFGLSLIIVIDQKYSIISIYLTYGFIKTIAIILIIVPASLLFLWTLCKLILKDILNLVRFVLDQSRLTKLYFIADSRPTTAIEAINILHSFKSDPGKAQYVQALFKWLPVSTDSDALMVEASKHYGIVSDNLYQLAEIWDDSMQKKR